MALLSVRDLEVRFFTRRATIHAVNGISFDLDAGETLGIVGESGCGKSVSSLAMLGILPKSGRVTGGEVLFGDRDLVKPCRVQPVDGSKARFRAPDGDVRLAKARLLGAVSGRLDGPAGDLELAPERLLADPEPRLRSTAAPRCGAAARRLATARDRPDRRRVACGLFPPVRGRPAVRR